MAENVAFSGHSFMCDLVGFSVRQLVLKVAQLVLKLKVQPSYIGNPVTQLSNFQNPTTISQICAFSSNTHKTLVTEARVQLDQTV